MRKKILKVLVLQMMGLVISQCVLYGHNPLAISWFGAMSAVDGMGILTLFIMGIGLYYSLGVVKTVKYGMIMVAMLCCLKVYRRKTGLMSERATCAIAGCVTGIMELADWFMDVEIYKLYGRGMVKENYYQLIIIATLIIAVISGTSVFFIGVTNLIGIGKYEYPNSNPINKQINNAIRRNNKRILNLSMGYRDLAYKIQDMPVSNIMDKSDLNIEKMAGQITGLVCGGCGNCMACWGNEAAKSKENLIEMMNIARIDGTLSKERLPTNLAAQCVNQKELVSGVNHIFERAKLNFMWRTKIEESRQAIALQLSEMADMVENFAQSDYQTVAIDVGMEQYIKKRLKDEKVIVKKINVSKNNKGIIEIETTLRTKSRNGISVEVIENVIGECIGKRIKALGGRKNAEYDYSQYLTKDYMRIKLVEETNFIALYGMAKMTKDGEEVSGDNYSTMDIGTGEIFIGICDGMGSGKKANKYSLLMIELLEQLLKNGFSEEVALRLINSTLLIGNQWDSPLATDIGIIDLYSGMCNIVKMSSASTYIKRGGWVECLKSLTLPIGVVNSFEPENVSKKLYNGDFIVMISDGIIEAIGDKNKEEMLSKIIMSITTPNPKEMARQILEQAVGDKCAKDDMTVLVVGVWDRV